MRRLLAACAAGALLAGCGSEGGAPPGPPATQVTALVVTPDSLLLPAIPSTLRLTVTATLSDARVEDVTASARTLYTASSPAVAAAGGGLVSAAGEGVTQVVVEHERFSDTVHVTVDESAAIAVESFATNLDTVTIAVDELVGIAATAVWTNGARLVVTGLPFAYQSSDPAIADVSPNGIVRGRAAGRATIAVTYRDNVREVSVTVVQSGSTVSFRALVLPVLQGNCAVTGCHSGVGTAQKGLRLNSYDNVLAGSVNGPVVFAGDGPESPIVLALRGTLPNRYRMPLGRTPLAESTIGAITAWIDEGAANN